MLIVLTLRLRRQRRVSAGSAPASSASGLSRSGFLVRRAAGGSRRAPRACERRAARACMTSLVAEPPKARSSRSRTSCRWVWPSVMPGLVDVRAVRVVAPDEAFFCHDLQQLERRRVGRRPLARQHVVDLTHSARAARPEHAQNRELAVGRSGRVGLGAWGARNIYEQLRNVNEELRRMEVRAGIMGR